MLWNENQQVIALKFQWGIGEVIGKTAAINMST